MNCTKVLKICGGCGAPRVPALEFVAASCFFVSSSGQTTLRPRDR